MIPALLGLVTGGLTRLAPVVADIITLKERNAHELAMGEQQIRLAQQTAQSAQAIEVTKDQAAEFGQAVAALQSAYQSVANTGVKWVDSINALIRPYYTVVLIHVWLGVKAATYHQLYSRGIGWDQALVSLWTDNDQALFAAVANFWFLGRVFDKALGR
jgi:hypothetical protein